MILSTTTISETWYLDPAGSDAVPCQPGKIITGGSRHEKNLKDKRGLKF